MNELFKQEDVEILAGKVLDKTVEKLKDEIGENFYQNISNYLYEHYQNHKEKVFDSVLDEITEKYVKGDSYKFSDLRKRMFEENKEELTKILTNDAIEKSIKTIILEQTHEEKYFNWQWKSGITNFILNNWQLFKDDEKINEGLLRKISQKDEEITRLNNKLSEIENSLYNK